MTPAELKSRLIKYSSFLLKTNIEDELNFTFNNQMFAFNGKEIGPYTIAEHADHFSISIEGCLENKTSI